MSVPPSESSPTGALIPSGSAALDAMRAAVADRATTTADQRTRLLHLYTWIGALQHQGADLRPFTSVDKRYYALERDLLREPSETSTQDALNRLVDEGFAVLETVQRKLQEAGPMVQPREGDPATVAPGGDPEAPWPTFQGNAHHTGYSAAPGPRLGRRAWRFPIGLGSYARPAVEDGRVYLPSLGMRVTCWCLDLDTGAEIWRASQEHPRFGIYKYPAIASTPLILDDRIVLREVNSHGGNEGQARNLVYLDKTTGATLARRFAGHVDYRTQVAPVATNGRQMAYPFGVHDIYGSPPVCQNFNRLICADLENEHRHWDFNVGDLDALAEPVLTETHAYIATTEGYLYALHLEAADPDQRVAWQFKADGALHTTVERAHGRLYFGCNAGTLYALDEATGTLLWRRRVDPAEAGARKHFSTLAAHGRRLYAGAANRRLYALDADSGAVLWEREVSDWIRARPAPHDAGVVVATLDGRLHAFAPDGTHAWAHQLSSHPIYADLVSAGDRLLVTDSHLELFCLDRNGKTLWQRTTLESFTDAAGRRIHTDELSGGTYYQSKPTADDGHLYFGTPAGFLHAVEADTGAELWRFEMGGAISVGAAVADGRVFAGQQGGERFFYALDARTGALCWKQTLPGGWVWGSATVDGDRVYVPTVSGYAVCLEASTGHIVWMYPTAMSVPAEPAVDGDLVFFGSWSRSVYAFDKHTGEIVWKTNGITLDSGTLIATEGKVYLPHHHDIFKALDARTGQLLCPGNLSPAAKGEFSDFNATPAFHGGRAYFSARGSVGLKGVPLFSTVYCVDPETAEILWTHPDGGGLSAPAIANGRVYIASGNSPFLYCLDAHSGAVHWVHRLGHRVEEATLCLYRDKVYALAADGYLHAIE